eukprot:455411_1
MGTTQISTQTPHDCINICTCFIHDKMVKNTSVTRYCKSKWVWSHDHELALFQCLATESYNIPNSIILVLKDHLFSEQKNFYVSKPTIYTEKVYKQMDLLLTKPLCRQWYLSEFSRVQSFPITLFEITHNSNSRIVSVFKRNALPALQLHTTSKRHDKFQATRRTLFINDIQISVDLRCAQWRDAVSNVYLDRSKISMIILNEKDDPREIDTILHTMVNTSGYQSKSYILVRIIDQCNNTSSRTKYVDKQLCKKYNISLIEVSLHSDQSIYNLFVYAVKLYWFHAVSNTRLEFE